MGAPTPPTSGPQMYDDLRRRALGAVATDLPAPRADHPRVSGVVVDVPARGGFATVVSMTDDSTSLYTSVGGGTIGAGGHEAVAAATHSLLAAVDAHLEHFAATDDISQPSSGHVRIFVLTPSGRERADVPEDAFWGRVADPLTPVIAAVQRVMSAVRTVDPG